MKKNKSKRFSDWEKKFSKEVKIETSKEFFHETDEGININPLYTQEDLLDYTFNDVQTLPGEWPILVVQKHLCTQIDPGQLDSMLAFLLQKNQINFIEKI